MKKISSFRKTSFFLICLLPFLPHRVLALDELYDSSGEPLASLASPATGRPGSVVNQSCKDPLLSPNVNGSSLAVDQSCEMNVCEGIVIKAGNNDKSTMELAFSDSSNGDKGVRTLDWQLDSNGIVIVPTVSPGKRVDAAPSKKTVGILLEATPENFPSASKKSKKGNNNKKNSKGKKNEQGPSYVGKTLVLKDNDVPLFDCLGNLVFGDEGGNLVYLNVDGVPESSSVSESSSVPETPNKPAQSSSGIMQRLGQGLKQVFTVGRQKPRSVLKQSQQQEHSPCYQVFGMDLGAAAAQVSTKEQVSMEDQTDFTLCLNSSDLNDENNPRYMEYSEEEAEKKHYGIRKFYPRGHAWCNNIEKSVGEQVNETSESNVDIESANIETGYRGVQASAISENSGGINILSDIDVGKENVRMEIANESCARNLALVNIGTANAGVPNTKGDSKRGNALKKVDLKNAQLFLISDDVLAEASAMVNVGSAVIGLDNFKESKASGVSFVNSMLEVYSGDRIPNQAIVNIGQAYSSESRQDSGTTKMETSLENTTLKAVATSSIGDKPCTVSVVNVGRAMAQGESSGQIQQLDSMLTNATLVANGFGDGKGGCNVRVGNIGCTGGNAKNSTIKSMNLNLLDAVLVSNALTTNGTNDISSDVSDKEKEVIAFNVGASSFGKSENKSEGESRGIDFADCTFGPNVVMAAYACDTEPSAKNAKIFKSFNVGGIEHLSGEFQGEATVISAGTDGTQMEAITDIGEGNMYFNDLSCYEKEEDKDIIRNEKDPLVVIAAFALAPGDLPPEPSKTSLTSETSEPSGTSLDLGNNTGGTVPASNGAQFSISIASARRNSAGDDEGKAKIIEQPSTNTFAVNAPNLTLNIGRTRQMSGNQASHQAIEWESGDKSYAQGGTSEGPIMYKHITSRNGEYPTSFSYCRDDKITKSIGTGRVSFAGDVLAKTVRVDNGWKAYILQNLQAESIELHDGEIRLVNGKDKEPNDNGDIVTDTMTQLRRNIVSSAIPRELASNVPTELVPNIEDSNVDEMQLFCLAGDTPSNFIGSNRWRGGAEKPIDGHKPLEIYRIGDANYGFFYLDTSNYRAKGRLGRSRPDKPLTIKVFPKGQSVRWEGFAKTGYISVSDVGTAGNAVQADADIPFVLKKGDRIIVHKNNASEVDCPIWVVHSGPELSGIKVGDLTWADVRNDANVHETCSFGRVRSLGFEYVGVEDNDGNSLAHQYQLWFMQKKPKELQNESETQKKEEGQYGLIVAYEEHMDFVPQQIKNEEDEGIERESASTVSRLNNLTITPNNTQLSPQPSTGGGSSAENGSLSVTEQQEGQQINSTAQSVDNPLQTPLPVRMSAEYSDDTPPFASENPSSGSEEMPPATPTLNVSTQGIPSAMPAADNQRSVMPGNLEADEAGSSSSQISTSNSPSVDQNFNDRHGEQMADGGENGINNNAADNASQGGSEGVVEQIITTSVVTTSNLESSTRTARLRAVTHGSASRTTPSGSENEESVHAQTSSAVESVTDIPQLTVDTATRETQIGEEQTTEDSREVREVTTTTTSSSSEARTAAEEEGGAPEGDIRPSGSDEQEEDAQTVQRTLATRPIAESEIRVPRGEIEPDVADISHGENAVLKGNSLSRDETPNQINELIRNLSGMHISGSSVEEEKTETLATGELRGAQSVASTISTVKGALSGHLNDVKGNSNDPFVQIIGAYDDQDAVKGCGYRSKAYGIMGGLDFVTDLSNGAQIRYGALASYTKSHIKFNGPNIGRAKSNSQDVYFAGIFAAYEDFNAKNLKTDISLLAGYGWITNRGSRTSNAGAYYRSRYHGNDIYIGLELVKNIVRFDNGIQIGPWASINYNRYSQKSYVERGGESPIAYTKMRSNGINTVIGVSAEKEYQDIFREDHRIKVGVKAGWSYDTTKIPVSFKANGTLPTSRALTSHTAVVSTTVRNKLNQHWEISGTVTAEFNRKYKHLQASVNAGYSF